MAEFIAEKEFIYQSPVITIPEDGLFQLEQDFIFEWLENGKHYQIIIPKGQKSDGASVPRWLWSLTGILPYGRHLGPSFIHDEAYGNKGEMVINELVNGEVFPVSVKWSRLQCDDLFYLAMLVSGTNRSQALEEYKAVRFCGWMYWFKLAKLGKDK